ncbi:glycosyltransferase family 2 protein [Nocardioides sp. JQ2195]|uniref:glycosyltransferase family 2 protein n=1 Tax=Nocardioides sp. JQ2195 TaxID=2592334 RepID=UPI00143EC569|nr:glycosyltransferase family 2 protein [Nocardioides sp. JQ2195]QIX27857.1 glycosyltransferase family 2 protein [Nocardioides sp. JQ2195]
MVAGIDVVVVTHNSERVIGDLLDSLGPALDGLPARTVVVDNGSTDDTCAVVAQHPDCVLVRSDNRGYAAGINLGVATLEGEGSILVLNPDVRLSPGCVRALMGALEVPGTGIAAPRVLNEDGSLFHSLRREPTLGRALGLGRTGLGFLSETVSDDAVYDAPQVTDWALGAVLLVSRSCHDALGGWDESFFLYSEETDICLRAADLGMVTRYVPAAVCTHIGGASGRSPRIHAMQIVNRVRLYRRRHGAATSWLYLALSVASEVSWLLRGKAESREAIVSLLSPRRRPPELQCSQQMMPI